MEVEGIVIRVTSYKEKDAIVNVLTSKGIISFLASGVLNIHSKNNASVTLYSRSKFELNEKNNKAYSLKTGQLISSMSDVYDNLNAMTALGIITELSEKCYDQEKCAEIYQIVLNVFENIKNKSVSIDSLLLYYLAYSIRNSGISISLNGCIHCGDRKQIVTVDYENGGLVCKKCFDKTMKIYSRDYLLTLIKIFSTDLNSNLDDLPSSSSSDLLDDLFEYLYNLVGIKIKSYDLYKRIR